jgi:hypothetical protein
MWINNDDDDDDHDDHEWMVFWSSGSVAWRESNVSDEHMFSVFMAEY